MSIAVEHTMKSACDKLAIEGGNASGVSSSTNAFPEQEDGDDQLELLTRPNSHGHKMTDMAEIDGVSKLHSGEKVSDKPLPVLPRELLRKIVKLAMTANTNEHIISMPCFTSMAFQPGLNLSCLLLDHDLYHVARDALYNINTFAFNFFGTDMKTVHNSVGLYRCRKEGCLKAGGHPTLDKVIFNLGHSSDPDAARHMMVAFERALKCLRSPLTTNHLLLHPLNYSWRTDGQLASFCRVLKEKVKVQKSLVVSAMDVLLELDIRAIPKALNLDIQPNSYKIRYRGSESHDLGYFVTIYLPRMPGSTINLTDIDDTISSYQKWKKTAKQDCIVNGLDYVTDFEDVQMFPVLRMPPTNSLVTVTFPAAITTGTGSASNNY
ncbi:uncharacterized protein KY384_003562 [Bacidia gigantensis]|uniref:uncharacterized protein n=1 Tax=Bacidia gigantensis TaxID=2732470 RepID=UPI001D05A1D1|nr:uncharacterized protein KY384_003562 [Bacidia gigantensis]KAG8531926.1 hypothetical protein KY384_003562 [Bacidia gigantensis]